MVDYYAAEMTALLWLHLFSAVGWFGSFLYTMFVVFPLVAPGKLTPQGRSDILKNLIPRHELFSIIFGTMTIVFGVVLFIAERDSFGRELPIMATGIIFGLVSYILLLLSMRSIPKLVSELTQTSTSSNQHISGPPKAVIISMIMSFVFLTLTFTFMIIASTLT